MTWRERVARWLALRDSGQAPELAVTAVPVGRDDDGLILRATAGTSFDRSWSDLYADMEDAREAWRKHPLAKRLVGLTTAYVVGGGVSVGSEYEPLARFVRGFWLHNRMDQRLDEWVDELGRAGELFPVLFTNPVSGQSTVRTVPASLITAVDYDLDDYEVEKRYSERAEVGRGLDAKWWIGRGSVEWLDAEQPVMLHDAVNRPIGALRGESDLTAILPWLRRYGRWLEDRVRLNAAMRAFVWIVRAPVRLRATLVERYRQPPEAGSIVIAEEGEEWEAVAPKLNAADAERDGRAIRWMIVAGGPGAALLDIGEGEDSNLATGQAMAEQRRRFLRRRQAYVSWLLADLVWVAWERYRQVRPGRYRELTASDVVVQMADIAPEDNLALASSAGALVSALEGVGRITGDSEALRRTGRAVRRHGRVGVPRGSRRVAMLGRFSASDAVCRSGPGHATRPRRLRGMGGLETPVVGRAGAALGGAEVGLGEIDVEADGGKLLVAEEALEFEDVATVAQEGDGEGVTEAVDGGMGGDLTVRDFPLTVRSPVAVLCGLVGEEGLEPPTSRM